MEGLLSTGHTPSSLICTKHYWTEYLAGLFNIELLGGDKEYSIGDVEKEDWRLQENTRHSTNHPVQTAHPSIGAPSLKQKNTGYCTAAITL